jgi:hypothetical protein
MGLGSGDWSQGVRVWVKYSKQIKRAPYDDIHHRFMDRMLNVYHHTKEENRFCSRIITYTYTEKVILSRRFFMTSATSTRFYIGPFFLRFLG